MKPNFLLALALIAVGIIAIAYQGITYTTREKVVDIGAVHVMADKTRSIPLPPVLGAFAIMGGVVLLAIAKKP